MICVTPEVHLFSTPPYIIVSSLIFKRPQPLSGPLCQIRKEKVSTPVSNSAHVLVLLPELAICREHFFLVGVKPMFPSLSQCGWGRGTVTCGECR